MVPFLFYFFSAITIVSALAVVFLSKPTRALLSLIVTMFALAVLFLLLGAPFVAMVHLIVYAGAVLVLFLFVIMLQGIGATDEPLTRRFSLGYLVLSGFAASTFFAITIFLMATTGFAPAAGVLGTVEAIGSSLFRDYLLPFELTSLILLVGVFAAIGLIKKEAP